MNPSDLIVICSLGLSIRECRDLLGWYVRAEPVVVMDESIQWWIKLNARDLSYYLART
jgi:hypothetical protein